MKRETVVRWWPLDAPIPPGWRYADYLGSHHNTHGTGLIEKCDESSDNDGGDPRK